MLAADVLPVFPNGRQEKIDLGHRLSPDLTKSLIDLAYAHIDEVMHCHYSMHWSW